MVERKTSLIKLSRPVTSGTLAREHLLAPLQSDRRPVTWITGPAGSGKTMLASSFLEATGLPHLWYRLDPGDADIATFFYYLSQAVEQLTVLPARSAILPLYTPEYQFGLAPFSSRFFEQLYGLLPRPFLVVLDGYQEVPLETDFQRVMRQGLTALPEGIRVLVTSRGEPPPGLARLQPEGSLGRIGWEELRLSEAETREIIRLRAGHPADEELVRTLHGRTRGWPAGLVLLLEGLQQNREAGQWQELPEEEVFDYFAGEVLTGLAEEVRDFLLRTAFLPKITAELAEKLTGNRAADRILVRFSRNHFFLERHIGPEPVYSYHPLFRDFLIAQAKETFPGPELTLIRHQAAFLLQEAGQIEQAARLYQQAGGAEQDLAELADRHAGDLIRQGRHKTVAGWLTELPESIRRASPSLLYWQGMARLPFEPAAARHSLEEAFQLIGETGEHPLAGLIWAAIVDSYRYEWNDFIPLDRWIHWLERRMAEGGLAPCEQEETLLASSMTAALMIREPGHPRLSRWIEKTLELARKNQDLSFRTQCFYYLVNYYFWMGDLERGKVVLEEISTVARTPAASPLIRITWAWLEAVIEIWLSSGFEAARQKIDQALAEAEKTGVLIWNHMLYALGVYCSLAQKDVAGGRAFLQQMATVLDPQRRHIFCHYHYLLSWCCHLEDNDQQALVHAEISLRHARETGYRFPELLCLLEMIWVYDSQGEISKLQTVLAEALELNRRTGSRLFEFACLLARTRLAFQQDQEERGLELLRRTMRLGRTQGYSSLPWWHMPGFVAELCAKALQHDIEGDYVQALVRRHHLVPEEPPVLWEKWPWAIEIRTFGPFALKRHGQPVEFTGKVQKKPLEMLKALIAFGGSEVGEEQITDVLWPDADGDVAHKSFATTLYRLRQLLGERQAIRLREGQLSLDLRYCWVDALSLQKRLEEWEGERQKDKHPGLTLAEAEQLENWVFLYQGEFLKGESDKSWTEPARQRFRAKMLQLLWQLGEWREARQEWEKALVHYRRALEIDPVAEEFCLRFMHCCRCLGRQAEAVRAYRRCCEALACQLDIQPSAALREMYAVYHPEEPGRTEGAGPAA